MCSSCYLQCPLNVSLVYTAVEKSVTVDFVVYQHTLQSGVVFDRRNSILLTDFSVCDLSIFVNKIGFLMSQLKKLSVG